MKNKEIEEIIVDKLIFDLNDRIGLGHEWRQINKDMQEEIKKEWSNIIEKVLLDNNIIM